MAKSQKSKKPSPLKPKGSDKKRTSDSACHILQPYSDLGYGSPNESFGKGEVVLLPVEPYTVHVYWKLDLDGIRGVKKTLGQEFRLSQTILRFFDVTNLVDDGTNAHGFFDIPIDLSLMSCYIRLWSPYKSYFVTLGFKTVHDVFFPVARSNIAHTPRALPSKHDDYIPICAKEDLSEKTAPAEPTRADRVKPKGSKEQMKKHTKETQTEDTKVSQTDVDLTAMNEKAFSLGVSSQWTSSLPSKKDSPEQ